MGTARVEVRDKTTAMMIANATVGGDAEEWLRDFAFKAAYAGILGERSRMWGNGAPDACVIVLDLNGDEVTRFAIRNDARDVADEIQASLGYVQCATCHEWVRESDCDCIDAEESEWCCKPCNTPRPPCNTTNAAQPQE